MSATYALHQRREFLREKKFALSARLLDWSAPGDIKVDQVKMAAGEDVSTTSFKVMLPAASLEKLAVAPGGTTAKLQFGLSPAGEYGIPPDVDFGTSLAVGKSSNPRKGESCVAQSACQMTPMPDAVGARFADCGEDQATRKAAALRPPAGASSNIVGDTGRGDVGAKKFVAPLPVASEPGGGRGRGRGRGRGADRGGGIFSGRGGGGRAIASSDDERRPPHHVLVMEAPPKQ